MAFSIMVHRVPEGINHPMREMGSWPVDRFPGMGDAAQAVARINAAMQARGFVADGVDRATGLNVPLGVAALSGAFADGQLRFLRAENPSQDLIQLLVDVGAEARWRVFDAKSGDELVTMPPQPIYPQPPAAQAYTGPAAPTTAQPIPPQHYPTEPAPTPHQAPQPFAAPNEPVPHQLAPNQPGESHGTPTYGGPGQPGPFVAPNPQATVQPHPVQHFAHQPPPPQPPVPPVVPAAAELAQLAAAVRAVRPADAELVTVLLRGVGDYLEGELLLAPQRTVLPLTGDIRTAAENLRRAMYQPELGTWHEASVTVGAEGEPSIEVNLDSEPSWLMVPPARQFTRDLQRFPRATQHVPEWYIRPSEEIASIDPGGMFTLAGTEENALRRRVPGTNLLIPVHYREQVGPNGSQQHLIFEIYLPQDCWRQGTQSPLAQWVDQQLVATALWQCETRTPDAELIWRVADGLGASYLIELLTRHGITGIVVQSRDQNGAAA